MMKPFLTLALVMIALPAFAFNPRSIPRHQQNAPEQLEIEVTQIEEKKVTRGEMRFLSIEAKAKVSKVTESASGVEKGDTITVSILGRPVTAEVASLREIDWSNFGVNFGLVTTCNGANLRRSRKSVLQHSPC